MEKNEMQNIPYIVFEGAEARSERIIKRLIIALVIVTALFFASNVLWLNAWCSYDYIAEDSDIIVDTEGEGNANYIGQDGTINNGENNNP